MREFNFAAKKMHIDLIIFLFNSFIWTPAAVSFEFESLKFIKSKGIEHIYEFANETYSYLQYSTEKSFLSQWFNKHAHKNTIIHVNETNTTYVSAREDDDSYYEINYGIVRYISENIPISGCLRMRNGYSYITISESLSIIFNIPPDLFVAFQFLLVSVSLDFSLDGLGGRVQAQNQVTCRSTNSTIIQVFKTVQYVSFPFAKFKRVKISKKKQKINLSNWKSIVTNLNKKEMGLLFLNTLFDDKPICEARVEYLRCNSIQL